MKRTVIKIDEELCNGCEACVQGCHEGALQMIDGKARLVSELFCDGLGACIGECPVGAISLEEREAEPYDEIATLQKMILKGGKTILAHLKHLKTHGETGYLKQAVGYLKVNNIQVDFSEVHHTSTDAGHSGCPGSREMTFIPAQNAGLQTMNPAGQKESLFSRLTQWPIQLHLINPQAGYFENADVVLAADCVPFAFPDFHARFLSGKKLAIACPKLDSGKEVYIDKIKTMITESGINTLHIVIMEVPCCGGLLTLAKKAVEESGRKVPVKLSVVGIKGEVLRNEWL